MAHVTVSNFERHARIRWWKDYGVWGSQYRLFSSSHLIITFHTYQINILGYLYLFSHVQPPMRRRIRRTLASSVRAGDRDARGLGRLWHASERGSALSLSSLCAYPGWKEFKGAVSLGVFSQ